MLFVDWENRPALLPEDALKAWAVLGSGEPWTEVDRLEVIDSGRLLSEAAFIKRFAGNDLPPPPEAIMISDQAGGIAATASA